MKQPSQTVYQWIHQMQPVEKRYFRKYAGRHVIGKVNDYFDLFELILKNHCQSDEEVKKLISKKPYSRHFAVAKKQLLAYLLDAFHQYDSSANVIEKLKSSLHKAQILLDKGFVKDCKTSIKKNRKQILKYEIFRLMPELINIEKQLVAKSYYQHIGEIEIRSYYEEEADTYQKLLLENEYWLLFSSFYKIHFTQLRLRTAADIEELKQLSKSPLLTDVKHATTFKCKLEFFQINALKQFMEGNAEQAAEFNQHFIELFEEKPHMMRIYPGRYLSTFNNYLIDQYNRGDLKTLRKGISKLQLLPGQKEFKKISNIDLQVFRLGEQLKLNLEIREKNYDQIVRRIPGLSKKLEAYGSAIAEQNRVTIYYLFAYACFGVKKYDDCIDWTNWIIDRTNEKALVELQVSARLLNLIAHYEQGNEDLLYYAIKNVRRYQRRRERLFAFEKTILSTLNRLIGKLPDDRKKLFAQLDKDLLSLSGKPKERQMMDNFDYFGWIKRNMD